MGIFMSLENDSLIWRRVLNVDEIYFHVTNCILSSELAMYKNGDWQNTGKIEESLVSR